MSEENKALVKRVIDEMWNQRKVELADELYSKDFIAHDPNNPGTKGPEGIREIVLKYVHAFPDTQFTIDVELVAKATMGDSLSLTGNGSTFLVEPRSPLLPIFPPFLPSALANFPNLLPRFEPRRFVGFTGLF